MDENEYSDREGCFPRIDWMQLGLVLLIIIGAISAIGEAGLFKPKANEHRVGDTWQEWQTLADGSSVTVTVKCLEEETVFNIFPKGCTVIVPIQQQMTAKQVFEMVGQGYMGVAHGEYSPIPGDGLLVALTNLILSNAWSVSVDTGIAISALITVILIIATIIIIVAAARGGAVVVLAASVPIGIISFTTMTFHSGGVFIASLVTLCATLLGVVYMLRGLSFSRSVSSDGSSSTEVRASGGLRRK